MAGFKNDKERGKSAALEAYFVKEKLYMNVKQIDQI